jgi:RimJ/RimL family protein N-acetyltransferase
MLLRDFVLSDLDSFHAIFGDAEVMENCEPPYDKEKALAFLREFCVERDPKGAFAAVLKETNELIGYVLFKPLGDPEVVEIGWIFNKRFWRQGYAYEICSELIRYGFTNMKLHKICAQAIDANKSVSLMKKLGMREEGVQRKHTKDNQGVWRDLYSCAILDEDYLGK